MAKAALPVSPQHGHPFWIANELAEFDTPDSQEGRSSSGRLGSQRQSSSAGGERRKERFGSPIHQGTSHAALLPQSEALHTVGIVCVCVWKGVGGEGLGDRGGGGKKHGSGCTVQVLCSQARLARNSGSQNHAFNGSMDLKSKY